MAMNQQELSLSQDAFTEVTNADVSSISFQVISGAAYIRFTSGGVQPDAGLKGWAYCEGRGELNKSISELTSLASADRVWARAATAAGAILQVDHA